MASKSVKPESRLLFFDGVADTVIACGSVARVTGKGLASNGILVISSSFVKGSRSLGVPVGVPGVGLG
jgi:hypothetical protein